MVDVPFFFRIEIDNVSVVVYQTRKRTLIDQDTGETVEDPKPTTHASGLGIGDYMLRDEVPVLDENGKQHTDPDNGLLMTRSVPRLGKDGLPLYDIDGYKAAVQAVIVDHVGPDLANVMADKAAQTAQATAIFQQAVAMNEKGKADREAALADIDARQKAALQVIVDKHDEVVRAIAVERAALDAQRADFEAAVVDAQDILTRASTIIDAQAVAAESIQPETKE